MKPETEAVVLIHGLWLPAYCLLPLARRLERQGFSPHLYSYASVSDDLASNAGRLAHFLSTIDAATVHLVGHSLGGILIRALFHYHPVQKPGRIVTLGAPHAGSRVARQLSRSAFWRRTMGKSVAQLLDDATRHWPLPPREIGVISGTRSFGMGKLVYPGLPRPNDGLLTVEESTLHDVRASIVLPVSHTGMLFSRTLARQVGQFLATGRFTS